LVGASGVGKTKILGAIAQLKEIAQGHSFNGIAWNVKFETLEKKTYIWQGEFEQRAKSPFDLSDEAKKEEKYNIISEQLIENDIKIINRNSDKLIFNGEETVKLSPQQSAVSLLKEEELISPVFKSLTKVQLIDYTEILWKSMIVISDITTTEYLVKKYDTIEKIKESNKEIYEKLFLASVVNNSIFESIKRRYITIFPQVEDIRFAPADSTTDTPFYFKEDYLVAQIKEKGVERWIQEFSSGMFRSLMQIGELYLCPEGSVLLKDEFENSLGVNCIDELTNDILNSEREIQFILTSHHPYIINNIPYQNWKIVTRKGGNVSIKDAADYKIGVSSKHDAFMQLLQLDEFTNGIN
jgi:predicted ATPase